MIYRTPEKTVAEMLALANSIETDGFSIVCLGKPHENAHENQYELQGENLEEQWKQIVEKAGEKDDLYLALFELISYTNREQFNELNTIFIEKRTRADLPDVCPSCKTAKFTDDIQLKGIFPTLNREVEWFESECGWQLQLCLRDSFYGFNPLEEPTPMNEKPKMRIGEFRCPECAKKHREMFSEMLKDL